MARLVITVVNGIYQRLIVEVLRKFERGAEVLMRTNQEPAGWSRYTIRCLRVRYVCNKVCLSVRRPNTCADFLKMIYIHKKYGSNCRGVHEQAFVDWLSCL